MDIAPWRATAPENSFRFRRFPELDKVGRKMVASFRQFERGNPKEGAGAGGFPFKEAFLTRMASKGKATNAPALPTVMDRAIDAQCGCPHTGALDVQRDVGRVEPPLPCSGRIPVDGSAFPFRWSVEDWYEFEISKVRQQRFLFENDDAGGNASECTYKVIITTFWDHHAEKLAEDLSSFFRDIARQIIEEKLSSIRSLLAASATTGSAAPDLLALFDTGKSPFDSSQALSYDDDEKLALIRRELAELENQCVQLLATMNATPTEADNDQSAWPLIERLEPWIKMVEFWTQNQETCWADAEMSTKKYEFRKFFRVIKMKLPFYSIDFERRLLDTKSWLHRHATSEYHFIARRNIVVDANSFPIDHDPSEKCTHEHHRLFSFAIDWQAPPFDTVSTYIVIQGDSWERVAEKLGTTVDMLKCCNDGKIHLESGRTLIVPPTSTRKIPYSSVPPVYFTLSPGSARSWSAVAAAARCDPEELKDMNPHLDSQADISPSITQLQVPISPATMDCVFAGTEPTFEGDTFESIALRLGASVESVRTANPLVASPSEVREVVVPRNAKFPRKLTDPLLRPSAASEQLFSRSVSEASNLSIPRKPEVASKFPSEFLTASSQYPEQSQPCGTDDNWISYTSTFLDKELSAKHDATPSYNVNRLWPMQQVPDSLDSTPFEEDQTWFLHNVPMQQDEIFHPEGYIQDLPHVNNEQYGVSLQWRAP